MPELKKTRFGGSFSFTQNFHVRFVSRGAGIVEN